MYEVILELEHHNLFSKCIRCGIISITTPIHKMIYETYMEELRGAQTIGKGVRRAVLQTSIKMDVSEVTIYKVIKAMKKSTTIS